MNECSHGISIKYASEEKEIDYESKCLWKVSDELYNSLSPLRHSQLTKIFPPNTPLDYKYSLIKKRDEKPSESLIFGTASHLAVFQPDEFEERVIVEPDYDKRTKAGKEEYALFQETAKGKLVISRKQLDDCFYMRDAIYQHPIGQLLEKKTGLPELTGFFKWHDTSCKIRADYLIPSKKVIFDLKTTLSGHERSFTSSCIDWSYHTQAAFYLACLNQITGECWNDFVWIVIEKSAPYKIFLWKPDDKFLEIALERIDKSIMLIEACQKSGEWPGPSLNIETLFAPKWLIERNEL